MQKGKFLLETNFSPKGNNQTGFSYMKSDDNTQWSIGASLGYFVAEKLAIKGSLGYGHSKTSARLVEDDLIADTEFESESNVYNFGLKYYLNNTFPLQIGYEGNKIGDIKNNYVVGQAGYAWFIKDNLALEPNVRYGLGFSDSQNYFGAGIGLSLYF